MTRQSTNKSYTSGNGCDHAPVLIVYPKGSWYRGVTEAVADDILDAIENGTVAEEHLLPA